MDKAIHIAEREWEGLRRSFEMCGDIGDFNFENIKNHRWLVGKEYESFISSLTEMNRKLSQYGYATPEALDVSIVLASIATEKLGLKNELALAFGMGYGFVRTGFISYYRADPKQILFYKMFFPLGRAWDLRCDIYLNLYPNLIKKKLKIVFEKFKSWQDNPKLYEQDYIQFLQGIEMIWNEWDEMNK